MGEGGQARGPRFGFDRSVGQKQEGVFEKDNAFFRYCIFRVILIFEKTPLKISKNSTKIDKKHVFLHSQKTGQKCQKNSSKNTKKQRKNSKRKSLKKVKNEKHKKNTKKTQTKKHPWKTQDANRQKTLVVKTSFCF